MITSASSANAAPTWKPPAHDRDEDGRYLGGTRGSRHSRSASGAAWALPWASLVRRPDRGDEPDRDARAARGAGRPGRVCRGQVPLACGWPTGQISCLAQIRARHRAVPARVEPLGGDGARVMFDTPQPAVTPGQVVTVYDGDRVLGGGWIERAVAATTKGPANSEIGA